MFGGGDRDTDVVGDGCDSGSEEDDEVVDDVNLSRADKVDVVVVCIPCGGINGGMD
jgi:hypothetical protein